MSENEANSDTNDRLQANSDSKIIQSPQNIQVKTTKFCSECGAEISAKAEICPKCGVRVGPSPGTTSSGKNKTTAALLAFFLGTLGAHKFYLGNTKMGIIYLLISITFLGLAITGILAIYDFIMLLTMSDGDFGMKYG